MAWHHSLFGDLLVAAALIAIVLIVHVGRRRATPGATYLALLMAAAAVWAVGNAMEAYLMAAPDKVMAAKFGYVGLVNIGVCWLLFATSFSGHARWITRRRAAALWIVPVVVLALVFTNRWHGLIWPHVSVVSSAPGAALDYAHGPAAWLNVGYSYALMFIGSVLLLKTAAGYAALHRRQALMVLGAILIPWLANIAYFIHLAPSAEDFSPAALIGSAVLLVWSMFRLGLLDAAPVTHDALLATMEDGVVVADTHGTVVEVNLAAERLLDLTSRMIGHPLPEVMSAWPGLADHCLNGQAGRSQAVLDEGDEARWLDVLVSPLLSRHGEDRGRLIVLHDATEWRRAEDLLRQRDVLLETVSHGAEILLRSGNWDESIPLILTRLGEATGTSRVYIFRNTIADGEVISTQTDEWCAPGVRSQRENAQVKDLPLRLGGFGRWVDVLGRNGVIAGAVCDFPPRERAFLQRQGVMSLLAVPIFVDGAWWGYIAFDECSQTRSWTTVETEALRLAASILGGAVQRERAAEALAQSSARARRTVEGAVQAMGALVETRDPYTAGHERRVAQLAAAIAEEMGMDEDERDILRLSACMHDVGKIGVPTELLTKPVSLSAAELQLIRGHPVMGAAILEGIEFDGPVAEIVRQHHERLNGSGYPAGLHGDEILLPARILAVADVAEAMASHRPYRPAFPLNEVIEELRRGAGVEFDAEACAACERLFTTGRFSFEWRDALRTGAAPAH